LRFNVADQSQVLYHGPGARYLRNNDTLTCLFTLTKRQNDKKRLSSGAMVMLAKSGRHTPMILTFQEKALRLCVQKKYLAKPLSRQDFILFLILILFKLFSLRLRGSACKKKEWLAK